jgi:hypothetical protein
MGARAFKWGVHLSGMSSTYQILRNKLVADRPLSSNAKNTTSKINDCDWQFRPRHYQIKYPDPLPLKAPLPPLAHREQELTPPCGHVRLQHLRLYFC